MHRNGTFIHALEPRRLLAELLPGFVETAVSGPVAFGSAIAVAPDGKLFVVEQQGRIQVYSNTSPSATLLQFNFLRDTPVSVNSSGERGMFGIAFDPGYAVNRFVYVHYTLNAESFPNRIRRFTANAAGDLALPNSGALLLEMEPSTATNHNGGAMHFGPDGKLYVALGDNGVSSNAQSITTLKGKILRINPTPGDIIPDDNPTSIDGIAGTTSGIHRAIWAAGLRNPFTFAFQPGTGRMFINDVGETSWEEINEGAAGRNFGWPGTEGDFTQAAFPDYARPIYAYNHDSGDVTGHAIVGGGFYNPAVPTFPAEYSGDYFFGDYVDGWIRRIDPATSVVSDFVSGAGNIGAMTLAPDGSVLYLSYGGAGAVYRVQFESAAPAAVSSEFQFDGAVLPEPPHRLVFEFNKDVSASLDEPDLELINQTTGQPVPPAAIALAWNASTNTATFTFPGYANGILPDGNYTVTISADAVSDAAGNHPVNDITESFHVLAGDADHNGSVNLDDFNIFAARFGTSGNQFATGNFDYDPSGKVNLDDFNLLVTNFGMSVGVESSMLRSAGIWRATSAFGQIRIRRSDHEDLLAELMR